MKDTNTVVLDGHNVISIDATVAKNLSLLHSDLEQRNQKLIFWNWSENARKTLVGFDGSIDSRFRTVGNLFELGMYYKIHRAALFLTTVHSSCKL